MASGLKGKVAIVTGAGGGVGKSIVKRLASEGCKVVLMGRNRERLAKAAADAGDKKNLLTVMADITKEAEVLSAVEQTVSSFDRVDILVNNAGTINDPRSFHDTDEDQWQELIDTNMVGTFHMTKAVLPLMIKNGSGNIINVSSVLGVRAIQNVPLAVYAATKAGVIMFSKSIAVEYGQHGIRCNCVCPSTIRSSLIEPYLQDENAKKMLEATFPLRRVGEPDDIAGAVSYLCSDDAGWVTGSVLMIDGGVTAKQ